MSDPAESKTWKCEVCGYIHTGAEPPTNCLVCGAERAMFSPFEIAASTPALPTATRWRCTVCGYLHSGSKPPPSCPVCGAGASLFEPLREDGRPVRPADVERIVIVGGGIAALTAAERARQLAPGVEIRMVSKEPGLPYFRLNLTRLLSGEVDAESLRVQRAAWFDENRIDLVPGEVTRLDRAGRLVELRDGRVFPYDRLILASGAHPFVPPIPGVARQGVRVFRTLEDAAAIQERARPGARCVCIGGGLLGLETAGALARRGVAVEVLEGFGWLLPRQLPPRAGQLLARFLEGQGIRIRCGVTVEEITGDEAARGVRLKQGPELPADFVVLSTGVRPNSHLARQGQLKVDRGVVVDDRLFTSDPRVLACGDLAEHRGAVYGIWPASFAQGAVAGANAVGGAVEYSGMPLSNRLKVLAIDIFSIGVVNPTDASAVRHEEEQGDRYACLATQDGRLVGAALYGDTARAGLVKEAVEGARQLQEQPALLEAFPCLQGACD